MGATATILATSSAAQAAACGGPGTATTGATVFSATTPFSCTIGDKTYSNFQIVSGTTTEQVNFQWLLTPLGAYNMSITGGFDPSAIAYAFTYDMSIDPTNDDYFNQVRTSGTSSDLENDVWTQTLIATPVSVPPILVGSNASAGGASVIGTFPGDYKVVSFNSSLLVTTGTVTQVQNTVNQRTTTEVPGPLAILGAGTAFGFSRKLRRRIKIVA